jgi:DNA-binding PadR family transcriptional regulator
MADLEGLIKSYLPMTEASFLVLACVGKENHGYGIMQEAARLTDGRVSLGAGTVYTLLYRMENDGLIESVREEDRRKIYGITSAGAAVLEAEGNRLANAAKVAADAIGQLQRV